MTTPIPCKRPKVVVAPRSAAELHGSHVATCHVPRCGWTYPADAQLMALKSDANDNAARHRQEHRDAVPRTHLFKPTINRPGYYASCFTCRWDTSASCTTRTDAQASLDHHLATVHGLVSC